MCHYLHFQARTSVKCKVNSIITTFKMLPEYSQGKIALQNAHIKNIILSGKASQQKASVEYVNISPFSNSHLERKNSNGGISMEDCEQ